MTILTSLDITIDNTEIGDKKPVRDEDGMPIQGNVSTCFCKPIR